MLSPFQERIAAIIAGLEEAEVFPLADGGALIVRGEVDRGTRDLDFFGLTTERVNKLAPAVESWRERARDLAQRQMFSLEREDDLRLGR